MNTTQLFPLQIEQKIKNYVIKFKNSEVEGESKIKCIQGLKKNQFKYFFAGILGILTGGIFLLFFKFSNSFKIRFLYEKCDLNQAKYFLIYNSDGQLSIVQKEYDQYQKTIYFVNRFMKYEFNDFKQEFQAVELNLEGKEVNKIIIEFYKTQRLKDTDFLKLIKLYGKCIIKIPVPSFIIYIADNLTQPQFLIQYCTLVIWLLEGILFFAIAMIFSSLVVTIINYILLRSMILKLKKMAEIKQILKVFRQRQTQSDNSKYSIGNYQEINSQELVPGDIYAIENQMSIPCDTLLLSGDLLLNESSLTGESNPIHKQALNEKNNNLFYYKDFKKSLLMEGTKVLQIKLHDQKFIVGMACRTGFTSFKGRIMRAVLYPIVNEFKFYMQGVKFTFIMVIIGIIIYIVLLYPKLKMKTPDNIVALDFANALVWMLPPALPIFLSICQTFSLIRLQFKGIFGIDPSKTIIAGSIKLACFDKTGTLTQNSIQVYGFLPRPDQYLMGEILQQNSEQIILQNIQSFKIFASCHSSYLIDGIIQGDPLDVSMLQFSNFQIQNTENKNILFQCKWNQIELNIIRIFEFASEYQRMSSIVYDSQQNSLFFYIKGSPEKIKQQFNHNSQISRELSKSESIPENFDNKLDDLTTKGFRIIAYGFKKLQFMSNIFQIYFKYGYFIIIENNIDNLDQNTLFQCNTNLNIYFIIIMALEIWEFAQNQDRTNLESNIEFLGMLAFQNALKEDTQECIVRLKEANIECKIISGDNPLTTIKAGVDSLILEKDQPIYFMDYNQKTQKLILNQLHFDISIEQQNQNDQKQQIISQNNINQQKLENKIEIINGNSNKKIQILGEDQQEGKENNELIIQQISDIYKNEQQELAISGNVIDYFMEIKQVYNYFNESKTQIIKQQQNSNLNQLQSVQLLQNIILKAKVFARMKPEQKTLIIRILQSVGIAVSMIGINIFNEFLIKFQGDGTNDSASIKQADIGLSFSTADSSFSAPFSSQSESIKCLEIVLLEGKCTMANSVEIFRYYICNNYYKYIASQILSFDKAQFNNFQWGFVTFFIVIPITFLQTISFPITKLNFKLPCDNLLSIENFLSIFGQMFIMTAGLIVNYVILIYEDWYIQNTEFYEDPSLGSQWSFKGQAVSLIFLCFNIYTILSVVAFYISKPFKVYFIQSKLLSIFVLLILTNCVLIFLLSVSQYSLLEIDQSVNNNYNFLIKEFFVTLIFCLISIVYEEFFVKKIYGAYSDNNNLIKNSHLKYINV